MNCPDLNTDHDAAKAEAAPLLYRNEKGDWIMFHYGAKYEVAMNGSMLEKAMSALYGR